MASAQSPRVPSISLSVHFYLGQGKTKGEILPQTQNDLKIRIDVVKCQAHGLRNEVQRFLHALIENSRTKPVRIRTY